MKLDLKEHLYRQKEWSEKTFGPGERTEGIITHIRKELEEVLACPNDVYEWVDIIILGFDGALRMGLSPYDICQALLTKQDINENREWPDWRDFSNGEAIEHIRTPLKEIAHE